MTPTSQVTGNNTAQAEHLSRPSQGSLGGRCYQHCGCKFWTHSLAEKVLFQVRQKKNAAWGLVSSQFEVLSVTPASGELLGADYPHLLFPLPQRANTGSGTQMTLEI